MTAEADVLGSLEKLSIHTRGEGEPPLSLDLGTVLALPEETGIPYSLYSWDIFPGTLIFDFRITRSRTPT